ncbi:CrcB family protein [Flaviaesturariibacter amylovorans]|uniref:Fluoride-specific ion channel FluC n=1 Tax=Flaviaesturariibacter amylovorans TaxID=1084520 RepID=A0ABP8GGT0_9BACT
MIRTLLLVGIGGGSGGILRFLIQRWLNAPFFSWGTLLVNGLGCFLIGVLWALSDRNLSSDGRHLLMSGFCGGFTTLSAFTLESNGLLQDGRAGTFLLYTFATVAGGLLATFAGYKLMT